MAVPFNARFQAIVLRLLITDDRFCRLVHGVLEQKHFTSVLAGEIASLCLGYSAEYKAAIGDHFADEFARWSIRLPEDRRAEAVAYAVKLRDMPRPNAEYVLRRLNESIKLRVREEAALAYADLIGRGDIQAADAVMYKALRSGIPSEEDALDYFADTSALATRQDRPEYLVHVGVPAIDRVFGGFGRGQLIAFLGGQKAGKTWALQWLARQCLKAGLLVLHVSHEVGRDEMELRYDMMYSGRGKQEGKIIELPYHKDGCVLRKRLIVRSVFDDRAVVRARRAARKHGGRLLIKKYPMGRCTTAEVERYLSYLENYHGFLPDVVINDYVDIMDLTAYHKDTRHQINAGYVWSKGLADERNILVATASQLNREGLDRRHIMRRHVGEDIRKLANVDTMLAIGRSPADVKEGLAGLSVLVSRGEAMSTCCTFVPCFDVGQFCLDSWLPSEVADDAMPDEAETDAEHVARSTGGRVRDENRLD